jgi:hypothetical protein
MPLIVDRNRLSPAPRREAGKSPLEPLFAAVREVDARLVFAVPCDDDPLDEALDDPRATIMLIADGLGDGPTAFHASSLWRAFARASDVAVVVPKRCFEPYSWAAISVASGRPLIILIETSLKQEIAWVKFIQAANPNLPILLVTIEAGRA